MRYIFERNKWFYADQYCISPATSKGGFSFHPGDLSRKCHLCHGRHVSHESEHFTIGNGVCVLVFAGIMFLSIWFSQLYML